MAYFLAADDIAAGCVFGIEQGGGRTDLDLLRLGTNLKANIGTRGQADDYGDAGDLRVTEALLLDLHDISPGVEKSKTIITLGTRAGLRDDPGAEIGGGDRRLGNDGTAWIDNRSRDRSLGIGLCARDAHKREKQK